MDKIPIDDQQAFAAWLKENPHYTDWDIAVATKLSPRQVTLMRLRLGVRRQTRNYSRHSRKKHGLYVLPAMPPTGWRDHGWFAQVYPHYPAADIANLAGVSQSRVHFYALKNGFKVPLGQHPYNRRDWLYENYVIQGRTVSYMARKASVARQVIRHWLVRHGISPRVGGLEHGTPVWWRKLLMLLRNMKFVRYRHRRSGVLGVKFRNDRWDLYTYDPRKKVDNKQSFILREPDIRLNRIPKIYSSREGKVYDSINNPLDFYISPSDLYNASFLERRVLYHTLASLITGCGFFPNQFDDREIIDDLPDFENCPIDEYVTSLGIALRPTDIFKGPTGFRLMTSCFAPLRAITWCLGRADYLLNAMARLEKHKTRPLSLQSLLLTMAQIRKTGMFNYLMPMPKTYYCIFKRLGIKGPILDLYPGMGAKFLAARALGIEYLTLSRKAIWYAEDQGIKNVLGENMSLYTGQKVEWLIYDNDMSVRDREIPPELIRKTNHLMRFDRRNGYDASYKVPISWNKYTGSAIYLAVD